MFLEEKCMCGRCIYVGELVMTWCLILLSVDGFG